jgi:hypothetical protein
MTLLLSVVRSATLAERYVDLAPPEAWRGTLFPQRAHAVHCSVNDCAA